MGIPKHSIRLSDLQPVESSSAAGSSTSTANLTSAMGTSERKAILNGETIEGFYKEINPGHAKQSVLTSVFLRLALGDKAARELLVFDNDENIKGIFSVKIPDLKTYFYDWEKVQEEDKEFSKPTIADLLKQNVFFMLFFHNVFENDDIHAHNFSPFSFVDLDAFLWTITTHLKAERPQIKGNLRYAMIGFLLRDMINFFTPSPDKIPTHSPCNPDGPVNGHLYKKYSDETYAAFQNIKKESLAADMAIKQIYQAALQFLLTFQPELLRKRLTDYFGDLKTHMQDETLDREIKTELNKKFPDLFTTKIETFVEYGLKLFQKYYDSVFRAIVYFDHKIHSVEGDKITQKLLQQFDSFHKYLSSTVGQESVEEVKQWIMEENERKLNSEHPDTKDQYDLEAFDKRYLQVKRGSLFNICRTIFISADNTAFKLQEYLRRKDQSSIAASNSSAASSSSEASSGNSLNNKRPSLKVPSITFEIGSYLNEEQIAEAFSNKYRQEKKISTDSEENNPLNQCFQRLIELNDNLRELITNFHKINPNTLEEGVFKVFSEKITALSEKYKKLIDETAPLHSLVQELISVKNDLDNLATYCRPDYPLPDPEKKDEKQQLINDWKCVAMIERGHYHDKKVIKTTIIKLFDFIDTIQSDVFQREVMNVVEDYKTNNVVTDALYNRTRAASVIQLLNTSQDTNNATLFAEIIGFKDPSDPGQLNTDLITYFLNKLLNANSQEINILFEPVKKAFKDAQNKEFKFDYTPFFEKAIKHAKKSKYFEHPYTSDNFKLVFNELVNYVNTIGTNNFRSMLQIICNEYAKKQNKAKKGARIVKSWMPSFLSSTVSKVVSEDRSEGILTDKIPELAKKSCGQVLAEIFRDGKFSNENSFNTILLDNLLGSMKRYINTKDHTCFTTQERYCFPSLIEDTNMKQAFKEDIKQIAGDYVKKISDKQEKQSASDVNIFEEGGLGLIQNATGTRNSM